MAPMQLPLFIGFNEIILGHDFVAGVKLHGRVIAEPEEDGRCWIYGVTPGAIAESGASLVEAAYAFRERLRMVLVDCAIDAVDFESFKTEAEDFLRGTDDDAQAEWDAAREAVRAGKIDRPELPKETGTGEPRIEVVRVPVQPSENPVNQEHYCTPSCLAA